MDIREQLSEFEICLEDGGVVFFVGRFWYQTRIVLASQGSERPRSTTPERLAYADTDVAVRHICGSPYQTFAIVLRIFPLIDKAERILIKSKEVSNSQSNANVHPRLFVLFAFAYFARPALRVGCPFGQQKQRLYSLDASGTSCGKVGDERFHVLGACFIDVWFIDEVFGGNEEEGCEEMRFLPDHVRHARGVKSMHRRQRIVRVVILLVTDKQLAQRVHSQYAAIEQRV